MEIGSRRRGALAVGRFGVEGAVRRRRTVGREGLGDALRPVVVEGRGGHDLVRDQRPTGIVDVVNPGDLLVLEHLHHVAGDRDRHQHLLLVLVPRELDAVVRAPFRHLADVVLGIELGMEAEEGVAGGGGVRADVVPERGIERHGRVAPRRLEIPVEMRAPEPAVHQVHRGLVVEGPLDDGAEEVLQVVVVLLVAHRQVGGHRLAVEVVDRSALLGGRPKLPVEVKSHQLPPARGHVAAHDPVRRPAVAHVAPLMGVQVHQHRADIVGLLPRHPQLRRGRPRHILVHQFQALGRQVGMLGVELPVHDARRIRPLIVDRGGRQVVLLALLDRRPVKAEIFLAQVGHALVAGRPLRGLEIFRGEPGGRAAARPQHHRAPVPHLRPGLHAGPQAGLGDLGKREAHPMDSAEFSGGILKRRKVDRGVRGARNSGLAKA